MTRPARTASSSDAVLQTLAWMRKHGFRPVPLHPRSKAAINRSYVDVGYKPPDDALWQNNDYGVGVVTGPAHSGPVDVDLDCEEAVYFARTFLPPTDAVFGRDGKPASHYLYRVDAPTFDKRAFNDPAGESTIIEARGDQGHQTVMPGSLHEDTGEFIRWDNVPFPDVPTVAADQLMRAVRKVAIATLIVRHVWQPGYHNAPCKHLSGVFYYLDWPLEEAVQMIEAVMAYTNDRDKSRIPTVRATYKRAAEGTKVSGAGNFVVNTAAVDAIHAAGGHAICYLDAGDAGGRQHLRRRVRADAVAAAQPPGAGLAQRRLGGGLVLGLDGLQDLLDGGTQRRALCGVAGTVDLRLTGAFLGLCGIGHC